MKTPTVVVTLFVLLVTAINHLPSYANDSGKKPDSLLYIDNIHIVDTNSGQIIRDRQLQVHNGKIAAIKPARTPITDQNHIYHDGNGRYVTPGLIDMHVHAYDPAAFTIALSHGVTHLRLMNGVKEHLQWRKELEEGNRIGSTITVSSPIISSFKNAHMHYLAQTPAEATKAVVKAKQKGYDLIKAYGNLDARVLKALLREAKKQNIPVAKHGPHPAADMAWNELAGLQSLEHVEDIFQGPLNYQQDQQKLDETIVKLKLLDVPITPTLNIFWQLTQISAQKQSFIDALPSDYISPIVALEEKQNQIKRWLNSPVAMAEHNQTTLAYLQNITKQLYQAELMLLVGSDCGVLLSPHGLATHKEMELMQQAGLPNIAVLRAATINAAKALGKTSELGQVAIGYNADLILSAHNPLENLTTLQQPDAVVKHGRIFTKTELEQLRQKAIDERSIWQEMNTVLKAGEF
jgi:imidazolonepropionase-like amidohydrolase